MLYFDTMQSVSTFESEVQNLLSMLEAPWASRTAQKVLALSNVLTLWHCVKVNQLYHSASASAAVCISHIH